MQRRTAWNLLAFIMVVTCAVGLLPSGTVFAHALFVSAQPAPGAKLPQPPHSVRIIFSEPLNAGLSGIDLYDSAGGKIIAASAGVDPADPRGFIIRLPQLKPDRYSVLWHSVSLVDGHTRRGSYTFTVLNADGSTPAVSTASRGAAAPITIPTAADGAAKWMALFGLFLLTGPLLLTLLVPGIAGSDGGLRRLRRAFAIAAGAGLALLLVGSFGQLLDVWLPAGGWGAASGVLLSRFGLWWLLRIAAVVCISLGAAVVARRRQPERRWLPAAAVLVFLVALSFSATSHGAASARPVWGTFFDLLHLLAAAIWIGGVIGLGLVFAFTPAGSSSGHTCRRAALQRFSPIAGVAVAAVLLSGAGSGLIEFGSIHDLPSSGYGRSLLVKFGLIGVLLGIAALNAFVLRSAFLHDQPLGRHWLRWSILGEALLGIAVLVPAALMSVQVPSRAQDQVTAVAQRLAANSNPASQFSGTTAVGSQAVDVSITPAAPGINQLHVELAGAARAPELRLTLTAPQGRSVSASVPRTGAETADGAVTTVYEGPIRLDGAPGTWRGTVRLPDGSVSDSPLLIPIGAAVGATPAAASAPPVIWLVVVLLAIAGSCAFAATRAVPRRGGRLVTEAVGAAGLVAALSIGVVTAAGALSPARGRSTGNPARAGASATASAGAAWGVSTPVAARSINASIRSWTIPSPNSGLMPPAVGPDGSVWVSEMDTNKLARLLPGRNRIQELDLGSSYKGAMGIAVDPANQVWLAAESAGTIIRFDPSSGSSEKFHPPTAGSAPTGIALDSAGNVWFTEISANKIGRFDPKTRAFLEYPVPTAKAAPYWLAAAPDGRIWFTELSGAKVGVLDPSTGHMQEYATPGGEQPAGIAIDPSGTIWVGVLGGYLIRLEPRPTGISMTQSKAPGGSIYGVVVDQRGVVWAGTTGQAVYAFDPRTETFQTYSLPDGSGPWWPAAGADGSIWVALGSNSSNALVEISGAARALR